jgi:hypothetical protein
MTHNPKMKGSNPATDNRIEKRTKSNIHILKFPLQNVGNFTWAPLSFTNMNSLINDAQAAMHAQSSSLA